MFSTAKVNPVRQQQPSTVNPVGNVGHINHPITGGHLNALSIASQMTTGQDLTTAALNREATSHAIRSQAQSLASSIFVPQAHRPPLSLGPNTTPITAHSESRPETR